MDGTPPTVRAPTAPPGFWWIFGGAWATYYALFCTVALLSGEAPGLALGAAAVLVVPPLLLSIPLARHRRRLLRPERRLGRTVALHAAVGLAYATLSALAAWGAFEVARSVVAVPPGISVVGLLFNFVLVFLALDGFLMWSESIVRVQESRTVAAREAMLRAQAEAAALRARFNPHFVFNTLHSLILLIHAEPATAERAIEDVAALIRYASTLQKREVDLVPLGQELDAARRYAALETLRLGDRMTVRWDVPDALEGYGVPPLGLQLLLENAVKHGIAPRARGGTIRVAAHQEGDALVVTVEDDGAGADPATVRASSGRGLDLLRRRVEALSADGRVEWETAPGEGFRAAVRLARTRPDPVDVPGWDRTSPDERAER